MTPEEKKLNEVVNCYITHSIISIDGETMTLGDAIRELRGGDHTVTKWSKCSEQLPKTPRNALVLDDERRFAIAHWNGYTWQPDDYRIEMNVVWWINLPLPPKDE